MNYLRYSGVYILLAAGIPLALWAIEKLTGSDYWQSSMGIIPPMISALVEGQYYARHGAAPADRLAWRFAFVATAIVTGLQLAAVVAILLFAPEVLVPLRAPVSPDVLWIFIGLVAAFIVAVLLVNRFFLTFGAKSMLKSLRKGGPR
jgi:hypothetical protein